MWRTRGVLLCICIVLLISIAASTQEVEDTIRNLYWQKCETRYDYQNHLFGHWSIQTPADPSLTPTRTPTGGDADADTHTHTHNRDSHSVRVDYSNGGLGTPTHTPTHTDANTHTHAGVHTHTHTGVHTHTHTHKGFPPNAWLQMTSSRPTSGEVLILFRGCGESVFDISTESAFGTHTFEVRKKGDWFSHVCGYVLTEDFESIYVHKANHTHVHIYADSYPVCVTTFPYSEDIDEVWGKMDFLLKVQFYRANWEVEGTHTNNDKTHIDTQNHTHIYDHTNTQNHTYTHNSTHTQNKHLPSSHTTTSTTTTTPNFTKPTHVKHMATCPRRPSREAVKDDNTHTQTHTHAKDDDTHTHTNTHAKNDDTHTHTNTHAKNDDTHTHKHTHMKDDDAHTHTHIHAGDDNTHAHTHDDDDDRLHKDQDTHTHTHTHKGCSTHMCDPRSKDNVENEKQHTHTHVKDGDKKDTHTHTYSNDKEKEYTHTHTYSNDKDKEYKSDHLDTHTHTYSNNKDKEHKSDDEDTHTRTYSNDKDKEYKSDDEDTHTHHNDHMEHDFEQDNTHNDTDHENHQEGYNKHTYTHTHTHTDTDTNTNTHSDDMSDTHTHTHTHTEMYEEEAVWEQDMNCVHSLIFRHRVNFTHTQHMFGSLDIHIWSHENIHSDADTRPSVQITNEREESLFIYISSDESVVVMCAKSDEEMITHTYLNSDGKVNTHTQTHTHRVPLLDSFVSRNVGQWIHPYLHDVYTYTHPFAHTHTQRHSSRNKNTSTHTQTGQQRYTHTQTHLTRVSLQYDIHGNIAITNHMSTKSFLLNTQNKCFNVLQNTHVKNVVIKHPRVQSAALWACDRIASQWQRKYF